MTGQFSMEAYQNTRKPDTSLPTCSSQPSPPVPEQPGNAFSPKRTITSRPVPTWMPQTSGIEASDTASIATKASVSQKSVERKMSGFSGSDSTVQHKEDTEFTIPESPVPEELVKCIQDWPDTLAKYPDDLMFQELTNFITRYRRALTQRSIQLNKLDKDNPAKIAEGFLLGAVNMLARKVSQMPKQVLMPEILKTETTSSRSMFCEHHAHKLMACMTGINQHPVTDTIKNQGTTFFIHRDPFETSFSTMNFIEALLSTVSVFYEPCLNITMHESDQSPIVKLFEIMGTWQRKGEALVIPRGITKSGETPPITLINALKSTIDVNHPFYTFLDKTELDVSTVEFFKLSKNAQQKNQDNFKQSLQRLMQGTLESLVTEGKSTSTAVKQKVTHPKKTHSQSTPIVSKPSPLYTPLPDEPAPSSKKSLAKQVTMRIQEGNTTELMEALEGSWEEIIELRESQKQKLREYLREKAPYFFDKHNKKLR